MRLADVVAEVWLNDIPLARVDGTKTTVHSRVAHGYLVPETNRIEMVLAPGSTPSVVRTGPAASECPSGAKASARVVRYKVDEITGEDAGDTLLACRLDEAGSATQKPGVPKIVSASGEVGAPFSRWAWQDAEVLTFEKAQRDAVALVQRVHEDFSRGHPDHILALTAILHQESARCLPGWTADELRADLAATVRSTSASAAAMRPLVTENFDLRPCAGGRLIECIGKDWEPLIQRGPDSSGSAFSFRMFVGIYRGSWMILRSS